MRQRYEAACRPYKAFKGNLKICIPVRNRQKCPKSDRDARLLARRNQLIQRQSRGLLPDGPRLVPVREFDHEVLLGPGPRGTLVRDD